MKKFWFFVMALAVGTSFFLPKEQSKKTTLISEISSITPTSTPQSFSQALFVPYWTLAASPSGDYQRFIYFGITPSTTGVQLQESGYTSLHLFTQRFHTPKSKRLLAVRMVDADVSEKILQDPALQQKIIQETITIAKENHFDGVVLDLEYNAIAFESVVTSITQFSSNFATTVTSNNLLFYQTFFGDTFFLGRPYDVKKLASMDDGIFVMAYDFHKANGNPGPNFPFSDTSDDYTFQTMVSDFEKAVDKKKITIVFGMFGYDWTVDEKDRSTKPAVSMSTDDILQKFVVHCAYKDCTVQQNNALETQVKYIDGNGNRHSVWLEDRTSVEIKKEFLQKKGINSIAFWANGYF